MGVTDMNIEAFVTSNKMATKELHEFYLGLDCGQAQDYSALSILQRQANRYDVVHLERLPLDMPYPQQIEHIHRIWHKKPISTANKVLAIDYTGVGRPIVDLAQDRGLRPIGVAITGGNSVSWNEDKTRASVPKRDLIAGLQIAAQNDCLKVATGLEFGPVLADELQSFKVRIDPRTAHDSYGSWREGQHDDLVLSLAIALWVAQNRDAPTHAVFRYISRIGR
jgi:hypothetical protein